MHRRQIDSYDGSVDFLAEKVSRPLQKLWAKESAVSSQPIPRERSLKTFRLIATVMLAFGFFGGAAFAQAPMVKTQVPGYYRIMVGDFEVTALSDGTIKLPMLKLLGNAKPADLAKALKLGFLKEMVETSVNGFLVNTGTKLVLIDTGAAGLFGPTLGNLVANLKASGYQPEQVDEIYITHMHPDHVGGLMNASALAFTNAVVRIDQADTDYWLNKSNLNAAPDGAKDFFKGAMASVDPYVAAGRLKTFSGGTELVQGIRSISTYGHTPGHTGYAIESKGEKLELWGDLMHVGAVQFDNPKVTIAFDSDSKLARKRREEAFADAAKNGYMVGLAHVAFPGIGHLRVAKDGKGYIWVPLNYSSLR
jgi:glyoxylase-like metal-dependent hydrolase (beta-lactamase superfamily II)